MSHIFSRDKLNRTRDWLKGKVPKQRAIPIIALCFVIAVSVAIGVLYYQGRLGQTTGLAYLKYYGYPGVFVVSLIWNSTVLVPIPSFWIYYFLVAPPFSFFPPLVGLAGGAGAAIGELTGYMAGYSGRGFLQKRRGYARAERWVKRWGIIPIFAFNMVPFFPFDVMGVASGALRFPLRKYFPIVLAGRTLAYTLVACVGAGWIPLPFLKPP